MTATTETQAGRKTGFPLNSVDFRRIGRGVISHLIGYVAGGLMGAYIFGAPDWCNVVSTLLWILACAAVKPPAP